MYTGQTSAEDTQGLDQISAGSPDTLLIWDNLHPDLFSLLMQDIFCSNIYFYLMQLFLRFIISFIGLGSKQLKSRRKISFITQTQ